MKRNGQHHQPETIHKLCQMILENTKDGVIIISDGEIARKFKEQTGTKVSSICVRDYRVKMRIGAYPAKMWSGKNGKKYITHEQYEEIAGRITTLVDIMKAQGTRIKNIEEKIFSC